MTYSASDLADEVTERLLTDAQQVDVQNFEDENDRHRQAATLCIQNFDNVCRALGAARRLLREHKAAQVVEVAQLIVRIDRLIGDE